MNTFLQGATETLHEMQTALLAGNHTVLAQAAHKLKGASANLHIHNLAQLALALETRSKAGQQDGAAMLQILTEFERVAASLRTAIAAQPPKQAASG
jgi:HPt (histidine-containing phosphotransfer) domain-containing protein